MGLSNGSGVWIGVWSWVLCKAVTQALSADMASMVMMQKKLQACLS